MKKNAMLKIAAILMVAVLLTTCAISSTFAKYVTSGEAYDDARVAKFGVKVTTSLENFFTTDPDAQVSSDGTDADAGATLTITDVVAPGTVSSGEIKSTITGTPEVKVSVGYVADIELSGWTVKVDPENSEETETYCPLIFKVGTQEYSMKEGNYASLDEFEAAVEGAIDDFNKEYNAKANLATETANDLKISWRWAFDKDSAVTGNAGDTDYNDDNYDTQLGDIAAADVTKASTVTVKITTTVTQVD